MNDIAHVVHDGTAETVRVVKSTRVGTRTLIEYETRDGKAGSTTTTYSTIALAREIATELAEDWG